MEDKNDVNIFIYHAYSNVYHAGAFSPSGVSVKVRVRTLEWTGPSATRCIQ